MAANKILEEFYAFVNFARDGFKYNLQVFPDTITAASLLFSLLFQSPPLAALSGSLILLNFIHPVFARFLSNFVNGAVGAEQGMRCSGHFPGVSLERAMFASGPSDTQWPSYYSMFLGFLGGYVGLLPYIYRKELEASTRRRAASIFGIIVLVIVLLLGLVFRVLSGCDTIAGTLLGVAAGGVLGLIFVGFLAWISERRITNILAMPLIRDRASDGKPIYVCERSASS